MNGYIYIYIYTSIYSFITYSLVYASILIIFIPDRWKYSVAW